MNRRETITFLFTDIEGSTRLFERLGEGYPPLLREHMTILQEAVAAEQGRVFGTEGDAVFASFSSAACAVAAASTAQRLLASHTWPDGVNLRVRMGIHTGEVVASGDDYVGIDLHRVARITAAGHGGQVVVSKTTQSLVAGALPTDTKLADLGEHRLKDLSRPEHLFQLDISGLPGSFPPLRTLDSIPNNLPTQLTSFVGREREVREASQLLSTSRLLTLTGPGGTGKTRLSLQVGAEMVDAFSGGAFFVPLAATRDPESVPSAILQALTLQEVGGRPPAEILTEHLREREVLLILDNFEQILAAGPFVSQLLRGAPRLKVLVTSRAALGVSGEQEYPVPPLGVPDPAHLPDPAALSQYESVALFILRAMAVKPDFAVTNENAPAVAEITTRLDGLPLAIELAAARIRVLSPQAILARLGDRLGLLAGGARDLPARQQTLRGAIAWSYDLLNEAEQKLLARLSVFSGGATLEEAEAVCGPHLGVDVFDGLDALVGQSLLRHEEGRLGQVRFFMLETIREYAAERLEESGSTGELHRRHVSVFLALAERAEPYLTGRTQREWLDRLEVEHDNFRAALDWAVDGQEAATALRLAAALWRFWQMRGGLIEGEGWLEVVLGLPGGAGHPAARARALEAAGGIAHWRADFERAHPLYLEALAIQREFGDPAAVANALYNLSFPLFFEDVAGATAALDESLSIYRSLDDRPGIAKAIWGLAAAYMVNRDYERARPMIEESLAIFRNLDDPFGTGWALHELGGVALKTGDLATARSSYHEGVRIFIDAGDLSGMVFFLRDLAELAMAEGDRERSIRLLGAADAHGKSSGTGLAEQDAQMRGSLRPGEHELTGSDLAALWAEGKEMSLDEAVEYALGDGGR